MNAIRRSLAPFLTFALAAPVVAQLEVQRIQPPFPDRSYSFGSFLDVDGGTAAVAYQWGTKTRALIYEHQQDDWVREQEIVLPGVSQRPRIAICGDTLFVARIDAAQSSGRVHVLERSGGVWALTQMLLPQSSVPDSHFGRAMDIDGERAVIAAPMDDHQTYRGGAAFIFEKSAGMWVETARIEPTLTCCRPFFGLSVALEGDIMVAGQPGYFGGGANYVYSYRYDGASWNFEQRLEELHGSGFGRSLDLDDGRLAVGAYDEVTQPGSVRGAVYLYRMLPGSQWNRIQTLWPLDPRIGSGFGATVDLDGPRLVVSSAAGELLLDETVQFYAQTPGSFVLQEVVEGPPGSSFGAALGIERGQVLIGAPFEERGNLYVYSLPVGLSYCTSTANSTGSVAALEGLGSDSVGDDDLELRVSPVPDTTGSVVFGYTSTQLPFGDGFLCLGGARTSLGIVRARSGMLVVDVDFGSPGGALLTPGSSWGFQAIFRDPAAGGTGLNTSDASRVSFRP